MGSHPAWRPFRPMHHPILASRCSDCSQYTCIRESGKLPCHHCERYNGDARYAIDGCDFPAGAEVCENCGAVVPIEDHITGTEDQGVPERAGSVNYFAGYNCPACGHHAEV